MTNNISNLIATVGNDLQSGACELALKAITVYQHILNKKTHNTPDEFRGELVKTAKLLIESQPAMAPIFNLSNQVLITAYEALSVESIRTNCLKVLEQSDKNLCENVQVIADYTFDIIPPGGLIFAYSFSSTVISALLSARNKGKYFRVATSEARPSFEGRKLAINLAQGGIEVMHTFDLALGLILPNCSAAFMGADCVGLPGIVNKVGSWLLAIACREYNIPLYVLCDTDKFVSEERLFEFEKHERPGKELWPEFNLTDSNKKIRILNHQFELVSLNLVTSLISEKGVLNPGKIEKYIKTKKTHEALKLEEAFF